MTRVLHTCLALGAAALLLAGCGGGRADSSTTTPSATVATDMPASDLAASSLRSALTSELTLQAYLSGLTMATGVRNGFDGNGYRAARRTLSTNAKAIAQTLTGAYAETEGKQLRELEDSRADDLAAYARARQSGDRGAQSRARARLTTDDATFGSLVASLKAKVAASDVAAAAAPQTSSLVATINSAVSGSPAVYGHLARAAQSASRVALLTAGGLAAEQPETYPGNVDDGPTQLRAQLTAQLAASVSLTAMTVDAGVNAGFASRAYRAAASELDATTATMLATLGRALGAHASSRVGKPIRALQRDVLAYARALDRNDGTAAAAALDAINDDQDAFGTALESIDDSYDHGQLAGALGAYADAIATFARADAAGSPKVFDRIDDATRQMPRVAQLIARGVSQKQEPTD